MMASLALVTLELAEVIWQSARVCSSEKGYRMLPLSFWIGAASYGATLHICELTNPGMHALCDLFFFVVAQHPHVCLQFTVVGVWRRKTLPLEKRCKHCLANHAKLCTKECCGGSAAG
jgi:hypothetical protein